MTPSIVHVAPHYPPYLGGLEKVVQALAVYQQSQGRDVAVLTALDRPWGAKTEGGSAQKQDEAVGVQRLRYLEMANTVIMPSLPAKLLGLRRGSLIHLHVSQAFLPEAVYVASRLRKLPYIAHVHIDDIGPSGPAGALLHAYKPLVLGPVLRHAARVVVFTAAQRSAISARYGIASDRIAVIPNGVERTFYYSGQRVPRARPRLLFVGRLHIQKNLPLLLRALAGVSEQFETTLVGDGELGGRLRELAANLELQNVRFHGRADGDELRDLYRNADIFVLPSLHEGMPLVLLEALAMGLPVVGTNIPGTADVINDGINGVLVPPDDAVALRAALLSIARDPDRYQRMSSASRGFADRYSWTEVGASFERLYAEVTEGPRSGRPPTLHHHGIAK